MTTSSLGASPAMTLVAGELSTPAGDLAVLATPEGLVLAAGFCAAEELVTRLSPMALAASAARGVEPGRLPDSVTDAVARYAEGDTTALDRVPVRQPGGAFFQDVWRAMREVPPGTTVSYAALARAAGRPAAVRAAGSACARNLVAPFVPCHRIVRTDGSAGGYAYGLDTKRLLLAHERQWVPSPAPGHEARASGQDVR